MAPVININLDDVAEGGFLVPSGKYDAKVTKIESKTSQSGNPMLEWTWTIVSGDHKGKELRSWTNLPVKGTPIDQQKALFRLKNHLQAFGMDGTIKGLNTEMLVGKVATLTVAVRTFKNRDSGEDMETNDVKSVDPCRKKGAAEQTGDEDQAGGGDEGDEDTDLPL